MTGEPLAITAWSRWGTSGVPEFWALGSDRREEPAVEALAVLARHCLDQAMLAPASTVGMVLGVGSAIRAPSAQHARAVFAGDPSSLSPRAFLFTTANAVAARVSILLGLTGESLTLPDPVAPFWAAADLLRFGRADAVLVGGAAPPAEGTSEECQAALICLESTAAPARSRRRVVPTLRLGGPTTHATLVTADETQVTREIVHFLEAKSSGVIDCGRRGRIRVDPADRRTEEHTA